MEGKRVTPPMKTVTIPEVEVTLEQLVRVVRQLEPAARSEIAKVLIETELDARMAELIKSLVSRPAADDVTDAEIMAEVRAVREQNRR
jgi:transposase